MDANDFDDIKTVTISVVIITSITLNFIVIAVIVKYAELREDRTIRLRFPISPTDVRRCTSAAPFVPDWRRKHVTRFISFPRLLRSSSHNVQSVSGDGVQDDRYNESAQIRTNTHSK